MAKYYVESGQVQVVFDAENVTEAAVRAFQWSCDKQSGIDAESPLEHLLEAGERGWQLEDEIRVSEAGFGRDDALIFDTWEVVAIWQGTLFPWAPPAKPEEDDALAEAGRISGRSSSENLHAGADLSAWLAACPVDLPEVLHVAILEAVTNLSVSSRLEPPSP